MTALYYEAPAGAQGLRPVLGALAPPDVDADNLDAALRAPLVVTDETVYARNVNGWPHRITDPREVLEALWSRDLWPWSPGDELAPQWAVRTQLYTCTFCQGYGTRRAPNSRMRTVPCDGCDDGWTYGVDQRDAPGSIAELVDVAARGRENLVALHGASVALRDLACNRGAPWVLRSMSARALAQHRERVWSQKTAVVRQFVEAFEVGCRTRWESIAVFRPGSAWRKAWPALKTLADRGAHLIESERWRVVIGVPYHPQ